MRQDDWLDESEYPDDDDVAAFGEDSPWDDDPLTIGYVGESNSGFWTAGRVVALVIVLVIVAALVVPLLLFLLR